MTQIGAPSALRKDAMGDGKRERIQAMLRRSGG